MKRKKELVLLYTRINGVERLQVAAEFAAKVSGGTATAGYVENREFHEALGLKAGGVR